MFGLVDGTISNYIFYDGQCVLGALVKKKLGELVSPCAEERAVMSGLAFGFPKYFDFVDGTKK